MNVGTSKELVSEIICRRLRTDIIVGKLKPGDRLVELEIAKQFNSSQAPVRESLQRLQEQGLVKMVKHTGTFVSEISIEEMKELFELRSLIEKNAVENATYMMREEDELDLKASVSRMLEAASESDLYKLIECDMEFHQKLIQLSGRDTSYRIWQLIDGQIRRFLTISHPKFFRDLKEVAQTHEELLEKILSGNVIEARKACEDHILLVWKKIEKLKENRMKGENWNADDSLFI